ILVGQAETRRLNPTVPPGIIDRAYADDPVAASAEYGALFRRDIESFIPAEAIDAVVMSETMELPPHADARYVGFLDFAGGSGQDSATLAIAHQEKHEGTAVSVLDAVREVRPPFSPEQVCRDFAALLRAYRVSTATADRYAGDFPVEQMRKYGITVKPSERTKSAIYKELLPLLNSGVVQLLDLPRLKAQLAGLERRTARGGRDSIDHAPGGHDDVVNAAAGALVLAVLHKGRRAGTWGRKITKSRPTHDPNNAMPWARHHSLRVQRAHLGSVLEGRNADRPKGPWDN
ncbi:MAG: hypothetical protein IH865_10435, partial [Chloroflexi bacterium]|nr:hypothetical protein [Chloroflexota bacterium]